MYRNESDSAWVNRFSVDVKDASGLVRRGFVRDLIAGQGLILDFDYPGHNADLIPFGDCLQPTIETTNSFRPGDAVEVLLQRNADEPWYWYPAKAHPLDPRNCPAGFGLVEVEFGGQIVKEVVLAAQLRWKMKQPASLSPEYFQKHTVKVSAIQAPICQIATTKISGFLATWKRSNSDEIFVEFSGNKLVYITAADRRIKNAKSVIAFLFPQMAQRLLTQETERLKSSRGTKRTVDDRELPLQPQPTDNGMKTLHPEILSEVLAYLDVVDRTRLLFVCRKWTDTLQATPTPARVEVDINTTPYRFAVLLHKGVTQSTKGLLISKSVSSDRNRDLRRIGTVIAVLEWNGIKLPRILIRGTATDPKSSSIAFERRDLRRLENWRSVCRELVLEKVNVTGCGKDYAVSYVKRAVIVAGQPVIPEEFLQKWAIDG